MNTADPTVVLPADRRLTAIRHGWLGGCELYLAPHERLPLRAGVYERELKHRFESMMAATELFLDIGAGEGFFSACLLRRTGARVLAFESDPHHAALLDHNATRNLVTDPERWRFAGSHRTEEGVVSLDSETVGEAGPILLKIDAEGEEAALLAGAEALLDREDTRVLIRLYGRHHQAECMHRLDEHGYSVEVVAPAWWRSLVPDRCFDEDACWLVAEKRPFEILLS